MRTTLRRHPVLLTLALALLMLVSAIGWAQYQANAGPATGGEYYRVAHITDDGTVYHATLLSQESRTMPNTTPVAGDTGCLPGDADQYAAVLTLQGTMAGTNPTLAVVLQHSIDGGATWHTVNTFTTINATVTPAAQLISFSDVAASTATTWGDCYRVNYTWGGSGTVTANVGLHLLAE